MLNGIQKSSKLLTKRVDVQVSQLNDFRRRFNVHRVLVVDRLNVPERRVKFRELQEKWRHLADFLQLQSRYSLQVMSQNLLCLLRLDVDLKVLLLVFALNWGGPLLVASTWLY